MTEMLESPKRSLGGLSRTRRRAVEATSTEELVRTGALSPGQELPLLVEPAVEGVDLLAWAADHRGWVEERLARHGGILFRGFALDGPAHLERFVGVVAGAALEYKERSSPRSQVAGNVYTSTDHPADQPIFFHNENSYQNAWPSKIAFFCQVPPAEGGATPIVDVRRVAERIPAEVRARFAERGVLYVRNFRPGVGLSWQTVFQTSDRARVEEYCRGAGLEPEWREGDALRVRSVRPAEVRHPGSGESLWFNHATFFHVSTLGPDLEEALRSRYGDDDLPANTFYGDGAPLKPEVLETLRRAYREPSVSFPWQRGDLLLLDNMLVAHAREPFAGERKILVAMAEAVARAALESPRHG